MSSQPATRASLAGDWRRLGPSVRWLLVAAGLLGVGLAVLIAVRPATAGVLPLEAVVALLGSDYVVVAVVGCLAVGCAVVLFGVRVRRGVTAATPPVVEGVQSATYPGVGIDRSDGRSLAAEDLAADDRRSRLRAAAIAALQAAEGCSQDRARGRVDDGSWTPDGVASAWLAADAESATDQAGDSRRQPPSERTVKRTLAAISRLAADAEPSDQPRERGSTPEGPQ